jgi:hypothetical protein
MASLAELTNAAARVRRRLPAGPLVVTETDAANHCACLRAIHRIELPLLLRVAEGHFGVEFMGKRARDAFEIEPCST